MATNYFKIKNGINIQPKTTSVSAQGDVGYNSSTNQVEVFTTGAESLTSASNTQTFTNKTIAADGSGNSITNIADANIKSGAAIAYSKLALTGAILNADLAGSIAYSKLSLTGAILNADLAGSIADTKLSTIATALKVSNSATTAASANTASAIVARDGSGNFSAGTISAALTGTASGNTTYTANNHGVVVSGSANAMTVVAPNASTAFPLVSGGASADPSWALLTEAGGGTNQSSYTKGDFLYASATNTLSKLGIGAANQVIKQVNGLPSWQTFSNNGINYVSTNPDAEVDTTGWVTYADTAKNIPADATGGSPNSTWTRTTSSPLRGSGSFLWTKASSANRQGEGVSFDFTVDSADQSKVLGISFDYKVASGTFTASDGITAPLNDNTTSTNAGNSDLEVFLYDVTNAILIPVSPQVLASTSTTTAQFRGTFQTASNSTSYRLAIHTATTTTNNYTIQFDNFFVGPQAVLRGTPMTDWASYTPTTQGFGTPTGVSFQYRRVGDSIEIMGTLTMGTNSGSQAQLGLPTGLTIDSGKVGTNYVVGEAIPATNGGNINFPIIANGGNTYLQFNGFAASGTVNLTPGNGNGIFNSSVALSLFAKVPVTGWSSNSVISNDADTRVVAASITGNPASVAAANIIIFPSTNFDTHGAYSTSTGRYTAPVSGYYRITGTITGPTVVFIYAYVNAVQSYALGTTIANSPAPLTNTVKLNAGDLLDIRPDNTFDATAASNICIERVAGPSTIIATDSVNARYYASSTSISGSLATISWTTKDYDTHSAMSAGTYTVPISGKYQINTAVAVSGTFALNNQTNMVIQKNGTTVSELLDYAGGAETADHAILSDIISCVAGDTIRVQLSSGSTSPGVVSSNTKNYFSICRLGN